MKKLVFAIVVLFTTSAFAQSSYGIDIPFYFTNSLVSVPGAFSSIEGSGGNGLDIGVGMFFNVAENIKIKGGVHFWNKIFNTTYRGDLDLGEDQIDGEIVENGKINYFGLYILGVWEKELFFIGGGFDIAFSNSYKSDLSIYNSDNQLLGSINGNEESYLTDEFNGQFDILINTGLKFKITDRISLSPSVLFTIPVIPLFDSNVTVYNPVTGSGDANFNVFLVKYGLNVEIML